MRRRLWLRGACAHCAVLAGAVFAQQAEWSPPTRFVRPDLATDEGGLWAMMDREETRLRRSPFRMRDEALARYLQEVVCRLGGDHCPDMRVYAVRTPYFNASMAPNGMMQVWSGLLLRMDNEAQLAAVLGHEIGHFLQRHSVERFAFYSVPSMQGANVAYARRFCAAITKFACSIGEDPELFFPIGTSPPAP